MLARRQLRPHPTSSSSNRRRILQAHQQQQQEHWRPAQMLPMHSLLPLLQLDHLVPQQQQQHQISL
jgi:hypothetical protein